MAGRMPILGQHHMLKALRKPIDDGDDRVAISNRESAAGAEIVLHVDDEQQIVGLNEHGDLREIRVRSLAEITDSRSK
jgi:hypothetical protein